MLAALAERYPQRTFRLDVASRLSLRHGDVVFGFEDVSCTFEVGPIAWPQRNCLPSVNYDKLGLPQADIIVSAADFDVLSLRVPPGTTVQECSSAMCAWLGRQRCHGVSLQPLLKCAFSRPVFCLPRRSHNTLVVTLQDTSSSEPLLMHTLDTEAGRAPSLSDLCQCPRYGAFWRDVLSRHLECVGHDTYHVPHDAVRYVLEHIQLVIDLARARLFGLRVTTAMRPQLWDLAHNGRALGIQWDILHEVNRVEVATQTLPAHWHALASRVLCFTTYTPASTRLSS